jgi:colanic acid biosynthesis protein WcaH
VASPDALIPAELYREFLLNMPVVCVDLLVRRGSKYLMVKRRDEPLKGEWWVPGGRVLKGEMVLETAIRKLRAETGIQANTFKFIGFYEDFYEKSAFDVPCHSISIVYETEVNGETVTIDETSEDFRWEWGLPARLRFKLRP